ncbi:EF-hand calcium-binding domain-containing protein 10 isoform 3-T3 [Sarcophilus harrisii]
MPLALAGPEQLERASLSCLMGSGVKPKSPDRDKPREFLLDILSRIKIAKTTSVDFPYLIDDSNLVSMFEIMDPTNQGFITPVQYKEALKNLGLLDSDEVIDENLEVITKDYFRKDVARKTLKMWLSF